MTSDLLLRLGTAEVVETDAQELDGIYDWSPTRHYYPSDPEHRRSGISPPQVGDRALCGYVKRDPPIGECAAKKFPLCGECRRRAEETL